MAEYPRVGVGPDVEVEELVVVAATVASLAVPLWGSCARAHAVLVEPIRTKEGKVAIRARGMLPFSLARFDTPLRNGKKSVIR